MPHSRIVKAIVAVTAIAVAVFVAVLIYVRSQPQRPARARLVILAPCDPTTPLKERLR